MNRGIRVLQTRALPLGYDAGCTFMYIQQAVKIFHKKFFSRFFLRKSFFRFSEKAEHFRQIKNTNAFCSLCNSVFEQVS